MMADRDSLIIEITHLKSDTANLNHMIRDLNETVVLLEKRNKGNIAKPHLSNPANADISAKKTDLDSKYQRHIQRNLV